MPEPEPQLPVILLSACAGLLVVVTFFIFRILSRLSRIEDLVSRNDGPVEPAAPTPGVAETSAGGAFEAFLAEDASRRDLPKKEQFAAYRKWRHEKGLNWSNS